MLSKYYNGDSENLANEIEIEDNSSMLRILMSVLLYQNSDGSIYLRKIIQNSCPSKLLSGNNCWKISSEFSLYGVLLAKIHDLFQVKSYSQRLVWLENSWNTDQIISIETKSINYSPFGIKRKGESVIISNLPIGIIHGDLYEGNVVISPINFNTITAIFDSRHSGIIILLVDLVNEQYRFTENITGKKEKPPSWFNVEDTSRFID